VEAAAATVWIQLGLGVWLLVALAVGGRDSAAPPPWRGGFSCGVRRILRRDLRSWPDLAVRGPGPCSSTARRESSSRFRNVRSPRPASGASSSASVACSSSHGGPAGVARPGYWQGRGGTLTAMVRTMAQTSQPSFLSSWLSVVRLLRQCARLGSQPVRRGLPGDGRGPLPQRATALVLGDCLPSWCCVSPTGCWWRTSGSSVGWAPIPTPCCRWRCSSWGVRRHGPPPGARRRAGRGDAVTSRAGPWWEGVTVSYLSRSLAAVAAVAVVLIGSAPMAMAAVNSNADPILSEALDGTPNNLDSPAPPFTLTTSKDGPSAWPASGSRGGSHVPRPVCTSIAAHRTRVPQHRSAAGRSGQPGRLHCDRGQSHLPVRLVHEGV